MKQRFGKFSTWRFSFASMFFLMAIFFSLNLVEFLDQYTIGKLFIQAAFIIIFLVLSISLFTMSMRRWNYLEIDEDGFTMKMGRGSISHKWEECSRFFSVEKQSVLSILRKKYNAGCDLIKPSKMHAPNKALAGAHIVFIYDYGIRVSDLVDILNEYRDRNTKSG